MSTTYQGTITGFRGSWGSGIGYLIIDGEPIMCENAPTVRALDGCFGDVIGRDHSVDDSAIKGQEIVYSVDDLGMLAGFTPVSEWTGPEIPEEGLEDDDD